MSTEPPNIYGLSLSPKLSLSENVGSRSLRRRPYGVGAASSEATDGIHHRHWGRGCRASLVAPVSCFVHTLLRGLHIDQKER